MNSLLSSNILKYKIFGFYSKPLGKLDNSNIDGDSIKNKLLLMTVAYNNANVIKQQIRFVLKNIQDDFCYVIADNSSNKEVRKEIRDLAEQHKVGYVSLHENPYSTGSQSHAIVLNWLLKQLVLKYEPSCFGFIDHDIYPVVHHSIKSIMGSQQFYGLLQQRSNYWYLWPGYCFFTKDTYSKIKLDFMPCKIADIAFDTGGSIYIDLFSKYKIEEFTFPAQSYQSIREGEVYQSDKIELIGNWLHSFNGSYWMEVKDKEDILNALLDKYYTHENTPHS